MVTEFKDKTALVVGGTTGIGEAVVREFLGRGCNVVFAGIEEQLGFALQQSLGTIDGARTLFVHTDVRIESQVESLIRSAEEHFGRIHFALNNAGYEGPFGPVQDADEADFDRIIGTSEGRMAGHKIYSASKHGIIGLSKAAALEQARAGIRINVIAPGPMRTGLLSRMVEGKIGLDAIAESVPMGRISDPSEIAQSVLWPCSSAASFVTGHTLVLDGGVTVA